jgi:curved DNA-binding protein CbpA
VSRGKTIKAIFFEAGTPRHAISNLSNEQLEHKLVKEGLATFEQIELAKQKAGKANKLGSALVEMGVLTSDLMQKAVRDQIMAIILSLFEWTDGDYVFDERIRTAHEVTLDCSLTDILLEGARHAANIQQVADTIAPPEGVVVPARVNGRTDTGRLMPVESYVLSRIESPTAVSEIGSLTGLPEQEAHRAACALLAAGLLKLEGEGEKTEGGAEDQEDSTELLRDEVSRKLHFFTNADYYEMLEVGRQATTSEIKAAYYGLAKKFHPDRYHHVPRDSELRSRLEALFAKITQAYDTLKEPAQRAAYDQQLRKPSPAARAAVTAPLNHDPRVTDRGARVDDTKAGEAEAGQAKHAANSGPLDGPHSEPLSPTPTPRVAAEAAAATSGGVGRTAEYYYQQGRARFDRKEYHAAVHLLREAVKLEPGKPQYHFHLGIALINNPRTRREAEQHLTKAAELDPYNSQIRLKLGMLYKEAGLSKKAEHFFREALSLDPDNRVALRELAGEGGKKKAEAGSIWKSDLGSLAKRLFKKS